jgi:hypothetical protein
MSSDAVLVGLFATPLLLVVKAVIDWAAGRQARRDEIEKAKIQKLVDDEKARLAAVAAAKTDLVAERVVAVKDALSHATAATDEQLASIHTLVNSQMTEALAEIKRLGKALAASRREFSELLRATSAKATRAHKVKK